LSSQDAIDKPSMWNFVTLEMKFWWQTDFIKLYGKRRSNVYLQAIKSMKGNKECNALTMAEQSQGVEEKKQKREEFQGVLQLYVKNFKTSERI
jgi:hypothetical protein